LICAFAKIVAADKFKRVFTKMSIFKFSLLFLWMTVMVVAAFIFGYNSKKEIIQPIRGTNVTRSFALPLNNPDVVSAAEAVHMHDEDIVYGVSVEGYFRAYPRWIMVSYHVANDTIDVLPIMLVQCEVCSSVSAFVPVVDTTILDFKPCGINFGTFDICDAVTLSHWSPFSGQAYSGPLMGKKMERYPVVVQTWKEWKTAHPKTDVVFATQNLKMRPHGRGKITEIGNAYIPTLFKPTANLTDTRMKYNDLIFGITNSMNQSVAFPLSKIPGGKKPVIYDFDGDRYLLIKFGEFAVTAFRLPPSIANFHFSVLEGPPLLISSQEGGRWNIFGDADPHSKVKARLEYANGYFAEWYEWITNHPNSRIAWSESK
jgi:hypothetical protein